ncbi:RHS repeat-associated core domain-containing protein [Pseudomonas fulva]|uniref:RHS repeat-associated core domain-containing protein n=1 Tax=Pseudomonas fulva TaxID=47880 RepID=UPI0018AAAD43|nr:RHS repeat-associated core domain-containing protein [Pseudomonas fulva]
MQTRLPSAHPRSALRPSPAFTPFGYGRPLCNVHMAFVGEVLDPASSAYLLGNGRRAYSPLLMRFRSPDPLSPMGAGGPNCYAYCANDPVNFTDPSGHAPLRPRTVNSEASLVQHYAARGANAFGSIVGMGMAFAEIAIEHRQLQRLQPGASFPPLHRARRIAGFHALATPAASDTIELFLPPEAADRTGLVDSLGLASAGLFTAEAAVALSSTLRTEGVAGLLPGMQSLLYAAGEVTLIGPIRDAAIQVGRYTVRQVGQLLSTTSQPQPPVIALAIIRNPEGPASS